MGRDDEGHATPSGPDEAPELEKTENSQGAIADEPAPAPEVAAHIESEDGDRVKTADAPGGIEVADTIAAATALTEPAELEQEKVTPPSSKADLEQAREVLGQILAAATIECRGLHR